MVLPMKPLSEQQWLVQTPTGTAGPYSLEQLQKLAAEGAIIRTTSVRSEDGDHWIRAGQIPIIFRPAPRATSGVEVAKNTQHPVAMQSPLASPRRLQSASSAPNPNIIYLLLGAALCFCLLAIAVLAVLQFRPTNEPANNQAMESDAFTEAQEILSDNIPSTSGSAATAPNSVSPESPLASPQPAPLASDSLITYSTEEVVSQTSGSVATIFSDLGHGSGFVVAYSVIVTNYHVVADIEIGTDKLEVYFPDSKTNEQGPHTAQLIAEAPDRDLALLRISCNVPPVKLDKTHKFRRGQDVVVIGSPSLFQGESLLPNAVTRGVLSAETVLNGLPHYQISNDLNPGNSGGPVFGMDGSVIGVCVSISLTEEGLNFCIPVADVVKIIEENEKTDFAVTSDAQVLHNARRSIRELTDSTLRLTSGISRLAESLATEFGSQDKDVTGPKIMSYFRDKLNAESPELFKDYTLEIQAFIEDDQLSASLQSDIAELLRRHRNIHSTINRPPSRPTELSSELTELADRFLTQLRRVNQKLELGRPGLFAD
jgi:serine protease Do